jgi:hypothetical protein
MAYHILRNLDHNGRAGSPYAVRRRIAGRGRCDIAVWRVDDGQRDESVPLRPLGLQLVRLFNIAATMRAVKESGRVVRAYASARKVGRCSRETRTTASTREGSGTPRGPTAGSTVTRGCYRWILFISTKIAGIAITTRYAP